MAASQAAQRRRGLLVMGGAVTLAMCVALLALQRGHVDSAPQQQPLKSSDGSDRPSVAASRAPSRFTLAAASSSEDSTSRGKPTQEGAVAAVRASPTDPRTPLVLVMPPTSIFSDYAAYTWPTAENLTAEVVSKPTLGVASSVSSVAGLPRPVRVSLDFPCAPQHDPALVEEFTGRAPVRLYVPWPTPRSNTQHPLDTCPVGCVVSSDPSTIPKADGYVVDSNGAMILEKYDWPRNPRNMRLIFFNTENIEGRRSVLKRGFGIRYLAKPYNHSLWEQFHLVVSYHWHSSIRLSFFEWASCRVDDLTKTMALLRPKPSGANEESSARRSSFNATYAVAKDNSLAPVLFFARNCDFVMHKRQGFVRKLREHIGVDAVGKCLNSREQTSIPRCQRGAVNALKNKRPCIISQYRFYLAVENSISLDYVTEKVYEPLMLGTIPVYLGAPNVVNFLPAAHSAIIATDFRSVSELAKYLKCVARNETLYAYYVAWRERPRLAPFDALQRQYAPLCQACMAIDRDMRQSNGGSTTPATSERPPVALGSLEEIVKSQAPLWHSCV